MQSPPTITLTQQLPAPPAQPVQFMLALTAEERTRSRHRFTTTTGEPVFLQLPRGTVLQDGDVLSSDNGLTVQVIAKPEPVLTVMAHAPLELLQAAYHLGNRHVALEIHADYLRLSPDPVLHNLLSHRGLIVREEIQPFQPEGGAYGSHTHESHSHTIHQPTEPTPADSTHGGHSH